jgi:ankyrin repeat protein
MSTLYMKHQDGSIKEVVQELRLAHFSVKEFLISQHLMSLPGTPLQAIVKEDWHAIVSQCCLAYLIQFESPLREQDLQEYPLACYSAQYWIQQAHLSAAESLPEIEELALRVLSSCKEIYRNWCRLYDPDKPWRGVDFNNSSNSDILPSPLYYASGAGLEGIVRRLLEAGADPNSKGGMFGSALQAASYYGHATIVENLLSAGANPNIRGGVYTIPLSTAVSRSHYKIVRILLERGADPDFLSFERGTPLSYACRKGDSELVRILLKSGATPNSNNMKSGGSPLDIATRRGHTEIVSQLLPKATLRFVLKGLYYISGQNSREMIKIYFKYVPHSALEHAVSLGWQDTAIELLNVDAHDGSATSTQHDETKSKSSALVSASTIGYESLVRQMIESGIDVNARSELGDSMSDTALACAAEQGHIAIVKLLLEQKADVNAISAKGDAVQRAALSGHQDVVETLVQAGANINQITGPYAGALQAAVIGRQMDVARYLLDSGANVNIQKRKDYARLMEDCGTALHAAIWKEDIEMAQYLLSRGADVNTVSKEFGSPLSTAASLGKESFLKLLLEAGANPDIDDGRRGTPLFHAIRHKKLCSVEFLIKSGARVNIVCRQESCMVTPLTEAILNDFEGGIKVLLENRADVSAASEFNEGREPPLHTASKRGKVPITRMLLDHGADVNRQIEGGWTALHFAARNGNEDVVKLLVEVYHADMSLRLVNGGLCLHSAATSKSPDQLKVIESLLQLGANINGSNYTGRTALHWAVEGEQVAAVRLLLQRGADTSVRETETNMTPVDIARMKLSEKTDSKSNKEIIEMLKNGVSCV